MGGEETEVAESTRSVLLEAANFEPVGILRSSERLRLRTEGSNRWEKGVDPHLARPAAQLATELIVETSNARCTGEGDAIAELPPRPRVEFRPERANAVIGLDIDENEQRDILTGIGFEVAENWTVTGPTWRARDVIREIDVVEEVARFRLEKVPFTLTLRRAVFGRLSKEQRLRRVVEDVLVGLGFDEAYTWSLQASDGDPRALRVPEPISAELAVLRTSLVGGLLASARHNRDLGVDDVALFEIARVYLPTGSSYRTNRGTSAASRAAASSAPRARWRRCTTRSSWSRASTARRSRSSIRARRRASRPAGSASSILSSGPRGSAHSSSTSAPSSTAFRSGSSTTT